MQLLTAFITGLIFGAGLIISGMTNPAKVLGFLDLAGMWNPSLALVMIGAIAVGIIAFQGYGKRGKTLLGTDMYMPKTSRIDHRLIIGGSAFGIGWGLAGFCPGPALASLGLGEMKVFIFVIAMIAGMLIFEVFERYGEKLVKTAPN